MAKDFYSTLEIGKNADEKTIKSAYRRLARKYHPDVNPGDKTAEAHFKEVQQAYEVLGDPEKRALYDRYGANWEAASQMGDMGGGGVDLDFGGFGSIFEQFFGGGVGGVSTGDRPRAVQPRDIEKVIEVSLEEIASGTKRTLVYTTQDACKSCDGTGYVRTQTSHNCAACNGTGQQRGPFGMGQPCSVCGGTGRSSLGRCPTCGGSTTISSQRKVEVKIPAGVADGQKLRVPGGGSRGANGRNGDLYVLVHQSPNSQFIRMGSDLETEIEVDFVHAALGGELKVPTLYGSVTMKIPECTQNGQRFRLSNQGLPNLKGEKGSLFVKVKLKMPQQLSSHQRKLLQEFSREGAKV